MSGILTALVPVTAIIAAGWAMRRWGFPGDGFWAPAERLTYFVLFPALIIGPLAEVDIVGAEVVPMVAGIWAAIAAGAGLMGLAKRRFGVAGDTFSSLFQGAIRPNTFVGIATAAGLWGEQGVALAAVIMAATIPVVNTLSVVVIGRYAGGTPAGARTLVLLLARNPLILACLAGVALNVGGIGIPPGIDTGLAILGRAALALSLLCVGAGLTFEGLSHVGPRIAVVCAIKLVLLPTVAFTVGTLLGATGPVAGVVALWASLPTAPSSYVLARQLGGDAVTMARMVAAAHVAAVVSLPTVLALAT